MNLDVADLDPQRVYQLLVGGVVPRPIAWISSLSASGVHNLAPYSFFTVASCNPPVLAITQVNPRDRIFKDTLTNLQATGDAVVNIVSAAQAELMNQSCGDYPAAASEFEAAAIASVTSAKVRALGVAAAQVRYECRLREVIEVSSLPMGGRMMLLDVVHIFVNEQCLDNGKISPAALDAIGKMGGDGYCTTRERFELMRPQITRG